MSAADLETFPLARRDMNDMLHRTISLAPLRGFTKKSGRALRRTIAAHVARRELADLPDEIAGRYRSV